LSIDHDRDGAPQNKAHLLIAALVLRHIQVWSKIYHRHGHVLSVDRAYPYYSSCSSRTAVAV
jgi:hypothetical protein